MQYKKTPKANLKTRNTRLKYIVAIVVAIVSGFVAITLLKDKPSNSATPPSTETIRYSPPTDEERRAADSQKDSNIEREKLDKAPSDTISDEIIISDASQYDRTIEIRSFISTIYKDGTCTFTIKKNNLVVSASSTATRDAKVVICSNPLIDRSKFSEPGDWEVTITYKSSDLSSTAQSKPAKLIIKSDE